MMLRAALIGAGATLCIDLWSLLLTTAFGVRSLDYCMLGRWVLHMPSGRFVHLNIGTAGAKAHECAIGWMSHYAIGIGLTLCFVWIAPHGWLDQPTLLPALAFGLVTVAVPFLTLQPALGLGIASSRAPRPWLARLKSIGTHVVFGTGIWLFAVLASAG